MKKLLRMIKKYNEIKQYIKYTEDKESEGYFFLFNKDHGECVRPINDILYDLGRKILDRAKKLYKKI